MGCCGLFGIVDSQVLGKITYPTLKLDNRIKPNQDDAWNCGTIWCLFVHNIMQQYNVPYNFVFDKRAPYLLPLNLGIGRTWVEPSVFGQYMKGAKVNYTDNLSSCQEQHKQALYKTFCEEMVIMWERLQKLHVESMAHDGDLIDTPAN